MSEEIKISDEARECGEAEIQAFLKAEESSDVPVGRHIQLLLNSRDAELKELRKDKERLDWLEANIGKGLDYGISRGSEGWWRLYRDVTECCKLSLRELLDAAIAGKERGE